jgi:3-hydroxyisobutyrate dehydrogenase-like beta-hydroxyacid dehydrogenase
MTVGVIGLGEMGHGVADRLCGRGHRVIGYEPSEARAAAAAELGVKLADSPREVAEGADAVVILLVGTAGHAEEACSGPDGGLAGIAGKTLVVMSSLNPHFVRELDDRARNAGGRLVDATLASGRTAARDGTMVVMTAGPADAMATAQPVLDELAGQVQHLGDRVGDAQTAKLLTQVMMCVNMTGMVEAMRLAAHLGVDPAAAARAICASPGGSFVTENWAFLRDYMKSQHVENNRKDLRAAIRLAVAGDVAVPVSTAALYALRSHWLDELGGV